MHIGYLVGSISRAGGGIAEIARRVAQSVSYREGVRVSVFSRHDYGSEKDIEQWPPLEPKLHPACGPESLCYASGIGQSLSDSEVDVCHAHGIWTGVMASGARWARTHDRPFVLTVHGMLEPWAIANSGWKKRLAGLLYANRAHRSAQCIQVNTEAEMRHVRHHGLKNPICIVPNGIDLPSRETDELEPPAWWQDTPHEGKSLLFLGRIHPKKGLLELLEAWRLWKKQDSDRDWRLVIAGWDDGGHQQEVEKAIRELELEESVIVIGSQFGLDKERTLSHVEAFILPSHSEGLPMAVLEAWSYGLPVLMTEPCNLTIGFEREAAIEITTVPEDIVKGLQILADMSERDLSAMGARGNALVAERFSWESVSSDLLGVYRWLWQGGQHPEYVHQVSQRI